MKTNNKSVGTKRREIEPQWVPIEDRPRCLSRELSPADALSCFIEQLAFLLWRQVMEEKKNKPRS